MIRRIKVLLLFKIQIECNYRRDLIEFCGQEITKTYRYQITTLRIRYFEFLYKIIDLV